MLAPAVHALQGYYVCRFRLVGFGLRGGRLRDVVPRPPLRPLPHIRGAQGETLPLARLLALEI